MEDSPSEEHKSCIPAVVLKSDTFYGYGHARKKNQIVSEQSRGVDPILFDPDRDSASFSGRHHIPLAASGRGELLMRLDSQSSSLRDTKRQNGLYNMFCELVFCEFPKLALAAWDKAGGLVMSG